MPDVWNEQPNAVRHSPDELATWAPSLRIFRYCRAFGGHNNDGDQLLVGFRVDSQDDLRHVLAELGIATTSAQPGWTTVAGEAVFVWVGTGRVDLSCSDGYEVTRQTLERARCVEPALKPFVDRIIEPPLDDPHCFCPRYYPDVPW